MLRKGLFILVLLFLLTGYVTAFDYDECVGWTDCKVVDSDKDFFTTARSDTTNWDLAIWDAAGAAPDVLKIQGEYAWTNCGNPVPFTVSYDPAYGEVVNTVDTSSISWNYASGKAFEYLVIFGKGNSGPNNVYLTGLTVNGNAVPGVSTSNDYRGVVVTLTDAEQVNGFTVNGNAQLCYQSSHLQENPAFHVMAMKTHDPIVPPPVPEFPTMALPVALIVGLLGVVLFIRRTKEN